MLGILLLPFAVRQFRTRPQSTDEGGMPKWMGAIDRFTPVKTLGTGALLAGANPKNLLLAIAAATAIAQTGISGGQQAIAYTVFALIGSIGVGAPMVIFFMMGTRSEKVLGALKEWMGQNNAAIMSVLSLVIGVKLIGDALGVLTS